MPQGMVVRAMGKETGDEDALLVAHAQVDPSAFTVLYDRYVEAVYRYCDRRLGDRTAAEDATSTIFTRAFVNLPKYRTGTFRGWLFTIAHNVVVDEHRRRRPDAPIEAADETIDPAPTPEDLAIDAEAAASVRALLSRLSPDQRQILELRLAGLSGEEIVAVLGRSRAAVDALAYRAVNRLRELLGERATEGEDRR
ncbi:MAG TPA: sigma-70 family RNA polymerase sigma factor [Thermomicrobiales bacterium]